MTSRCFLSLEWWLIYGSHPHSWPQVSAIFRWVSCYHYYCYSARFTEVMWGSIKNIETMGFLMIYPSFIAIFMWIISNSVVFLSQCRSTPPQGDTKDPCHSAYKGNVAPVSDYCAKTEQRCTDCGGAAWWCAMKSVRFFMWKHRNFTMKSSGLMGFNQQKWWFVNGICMFNVGKAMP